jgi:hypothetical protein
MSVENAQIAWAAGLFEGEGTIVDSTGSVQLRVKMTDLDVLERLLDVFGVGDIYGPYESGSRDGHTRASRIGSGFALSRSSERYSKQCRPG